MALSVGTIFEINSGATASNVNSGGFNPTNANMATDLAATSATGNSPVVTSASYNFVAGDVNHWIYIKSGTNWTPGWYKIASVAANAATLTASIGSAEQESNNRIITNTVAGCATVASPTGGTWSIDYSRSTASPFASTNLASTNGTTNPSTITSATNPFGINMVGNLIHITAGTNWTQGWYEIVSVSGTTATLDRAVGSAATLSSGTGKVGGALSLGSSDDAVYELVVSSTTGATRYFYKGGSSITYTINGTVTIAADGNTKWPVIHEAYETIRGDRPTGATRPTLACGAATFTSAGDQHVWRSLIFTGTAATVFAAGAFNSAFDCKFVNTSTTASRNAASGSTGIFSNCEFISYRGVGFSTSGNTVIIGCNFHDSNQGINHSANVACSIINSLFISNVTTAINYTSAISGTPQGLIFGNTIYGAENKLGTGISHPAGVGIIRVANNIFYGLVTGISWTDVQTINYDDYNDYYNNTNDVNDITKWQKGANDSVLNPTFTNVTQVTVTTATTSGSTLTKTGATFRTSGVTAGRDFVYITAGAGATAGVYGISSVDSETQLTLDIAPGNSTNDVSAQITVGRNFAINTNLKSLGFPSSFPNTTTTSYVDIGGVQRQESGTGGGGSFTFVL